MNLRRSIQRVTAAIVAAVILTPHFANASGLDTSVVEMFPKEVAELSYLDLKAARQQPWFAVAEQSLLPMRFRKLEFLLSNAGLNVETQVDTLAWGTVPATKVGAAGFVGVAAGHFSPGTVESYFSQHNLPIDDEQGEHLLNIGGNTSDLYLAFLDPETAAFGQHAALAQLLAVRSQGNESLAQNSVLTALVKDARQDSLTWSVWNKDYARAALQQLLPAQIPQATVLLDHIQSLEFDVTDQDILSARSEIVCSSPAEAFMLATLLQTAIAYRRHEATQSGSQPSNIFDGIRINAYSTRVEIEVPVGPAQLDSAIRSGDFLNLLQ
ncbi:MAG: hypothetical protein WCA38_06955 [Candidatus Acidiferrales bacterium]